MEETILKQENKQVILSDDALSYLYITAKWTKYFAIMGIISLLILILFGFLAGNRFSDYTELGELGYLLGFVYIIAGGIYVYPILTMIKFSNFIKSLYLYQNSNDLTEALKNLKNTYQYSGILSIIVLAFYLIFGFFGLLAVLIF